MGVNFDKLVPNQTHREAIRDAVHRVHKATILVTELVNLHVRRCFEERGGAVGSGRIVKKLWGDRN